MNKERQIDKEIWLAIQTERLLNLWETTPAPDKYKVGAELMKIPSYFPKTRDGRVIPLTTYQQEKLLWTHKLGTCSSFKRNIGGTHRLRTYDLINCACHVPLDPLPLLQRNPPGRQRYYFNEQKPSIRYALVTSILSATQSDATRYALKKWKAKLLAEGKDPEVSRLEAARRGSFA